MKPSSQPPGAQPDLPIIVTVIEAGPLEKQVRLLAESLRRWGGKFANAPIIAVQPRGGPKLNSRTLQALNGLDVEYCRIRRDDGYDWFPYLNKTAAVKHVSSQYPSKSIVWLDADILAIQEPSDLLLGSDGTNFAACASNKNIGTARDDDEFAPYFMAACLAVGVDFHSLPYIETEEERIPIRAYWNSGVYAFAAKSGLADLHHHFTLSLVKSGIGSWESKLFFSDQIALGLAAHHLKLQYRRLPLAYNFSLQPKTIVTKLAAANDVRILHYHACLWQASFENFCTGLKTVNPEAAAWLHSQGALAVEMSASARIHRKLADLYRSRKYRNALQKARLY